MRPVIVLLACFLLIATTASSEEQSSATTEWKCITTAEQKVECGPVNEQATRNSKIERLDQKVVLEMQMLISELGGKVGAFDGIIGPQTLAAASEVLGRDVSSLDAITLLQLLDDALTEKEKHEFLPWTCSINEAGKPMCGPLVASNRAAIEDKDEFLPWTCSIDEGGKSMCEPLVASNRAANEDKDEFLPWTCSIDEDGKPICGPLVASNSPSNGKTCASSQAKCEAAAEQKRLADEKKKKADAAAKAAEQKRQADEQQKKADAAAKAAEQKRLADEKKKKSDAAAKAAEQKRLADERKKKADAAAKAAEQKRLADEKKKKADAATKAAEQKRLADENKKKADAAAKSATPQRYQLIPTKDLLADVGGKSCIEAIASWKGQSYSIQQLDFKFPMFVYQVNDKLSQVSMTSVYHPLCEQAWLQDSQKNRYPYTPGKCVAKVPSIMMFDVKKNAVGAVTGWKDAFNDFFTGELVISTSDRTYDDGKVVELTHTHDGSSPWQERYYKCTVP
jgi:hypothetical protein